MKYSLCDDTWDNKELEAIQSVIDSRMFTMGKKTIEFETDFAKKFGSKYAIMVSSGSAANLLAIAALVYSKRIKPGDEVLVPAVSWSTTYFPLVQMGLKLRFVDIDRNTLNMSVEAMKCAITDKTRMVFLVNLLGNPNEFDDIREICDSKGIIIAEDNCESMGGEYKGMNLGTLGLFGTYSSFFSHHICTMEGGVVVTNDEEFYHFMLCVRAHGWTRNLPEGSRIYQKKEDPFYESFNFIVPGFNLRPLEMEAATGIEQLKKLDRIISQRRKNGEHFVKRLSEIQNVRTQKEVEKSSFFGFPVILENENATCRAEIVKALRDAEIEVRPIVAGNFTRNKAIEFADYSISGELKNADEIHESGFFVGNYSTDNTKEIDYFISVLKEALKRGKDGEKL